MDELIGADSDEFLEEDDELLDAIAGYDDLDEDDYDEAIAGMDDYDLVGADLDVIGADLDEEDFDELEYAMAGLDEDGEDDEDELEELLAISGMDGLDAEPMSAVDELLMATSGRSRRRRRRRRGRGRRRSQWGRAAVLARMRARARARAARRARATRRMRGRLSRERRRSRAAINRLRRLQRGRGRAAGSRTVPSVRGGSRRVVQRTPSKSSEIPLTFDSGTPIPAGASRTIVTRPQVVFAPRKFIVPSTDAVNFRINSIAVGKNSQFAASGGVSALVFSENANVPLGLDTAQVGQDITVNITNTSSADHPFTALMIGASLQ